MSSEQQPNKVNWRVNDFCAAFGIGRTTFYELVKADKLHTVKLGKLTLVTQAEAQRFQAALAGTSDKVS